jgi:SAM-dependent methyltransferase
MSPLEPDGDVSVIRRQTGGVTTRWSSDGGTPRGDAYDEQWRRLEAAGASIHGEADFVDRLLGGAGGGSSVLDAGCGTGRVAVELAHRGYATLGVDVDPAMLATARAKAPGLEWVEADLAGLDLPGRRFSAIVAAGNVMIFLAPGTEAAVVAALARHLEPGGLLVAGFQLTAGLGLSRYDDVTRAAGLTLRSRFATWDGDPFEPGGNYAVSVHAAP